MIVYQNSSQLFKKNSYFHLERCSRQSSLHWHSALEFIYIVDGSLKVNMNGKIVTAKAGEIAVVNSSIVHSSTKAEENFDYFFLITDDNFFKSNGLASDLTTFAPLINTDKARELFEKIIRESESGDDFSNAAVLSAIMEFFVYLNRNHAQQTEPSPETEAKKVAMVRATITYLMEHYKERLTIDEIADNMHFSKSYLSHSFKEITHYSLINYINLLRCQNARTMMISGSSIAEAATECGFSELSYFTRVFKKTMGSLPSAIDKEL